MTATPTRLAPPAAPLKEWLLEGHTSDAEGPYGKTGHTHPWW